MKNETCITYKEWDNAFCGQDQNLEGLCESTRDITYHDYFCKNHKLKLVIRLKRIYYKIKQYFNSGIKNPLKYCNKAKSRECIHIDGILCPCEEMNENNEILKGR